MAGPDRRQGEAQENPAGLRPSAACHMPGWPRLVPSFSLAYGSSCGERAGLALHRTALLSVPEVQSGCQRDRRCNSDRNRGAAHPRRQASPVAHDQDLRSATPPRVSIELIDRYSDSVTCALTSFLGPLGDLGLSVPSRLKLPHSFRSRAGVLRTAGPARPGGHRPPINSQHNAEAVVKIQQPAIEERPSRMASKLD